MKIFSNRSGFPGPVLQDFNSLLKEIDTELTNNVQIKTDNYRTARKIYYKFTDDGNSTRVINFVKDKISVNLK